MSFSQVNCSGKTARKGRLYQQKISTGERIQWDVTAKPPKADRPLEIVGIFKTKRQ